MMNSRKTRRWLVLAGVAAATAGASLGALAQPSVVKVVVPFPAGGVTDLIARLLAEGMARQLNQTFVVENRPGAGGRIGIDAVSKAPADGTTLLFTNSGYSILPVVEPRIAFDPTKALAPVSIVSSYSLQMLVRKDLPVNTLPEFIDYAKKNPGKLSYGSAGMGSGTHFGGEYFKALTGTFLVHIPYKSTNGALNDVAGGQLDFALDGSAKSLVDAGKVKLLAVTGSRRDARFPNTPTAAESGLKDYVMESWAGFLAPAGTPAATIDRLNRAAAATLQDPAVQKRFAELGMAPEGGPASRMAGVIKDELALYRKMAKDANLKFE